MNVYSAPIFSESEEEMYYDKAKSNSAEDKKSQGKWDQKQREQREDDKGESNTAEDEKPNDEDLDNNSKDPENAGKDINLAEQKSQLASSIAKAETRLSDTFLVNSSSAPLISEQHINRFFEYDPEHTEEGLPGGLQEESRIREKCITLFRKSAWELVERLLKFKRVLARGAIIRGAYGAGLLLSSFYFC